MKIAVIGSGAWGTALSQVLNDNGHDVLIYARDQKQCDDINLNHRNAFYFGEEVILDSKIKAVNNLSESLADREFVLLSVPTKAMRSVLREIDGLIQKPVVFINTSKGFDPETNETMTDLIRDVIPENKRRGIVSLLGPSHAEEVILRKFTVIKSVSHNYEVAHEVQHLFSNEYFRVYTSTDEVGAEYAAALKNGIAIASGILDGMNQGDNAKAALITRGLVEMTRIGIAFGADSKTFFGLGGVGDLVVTCYSVHSRNYQAGYSIGKNGNAKEVLSSDVTIEGLRTIKTVYDLNRKIKLDLPLFSALYAVIFEEKDIYQTIKELFGRPLKDEKI